MIELYETNRMSHLSMMIFSYTNLTLKIGYFICFIYFIYFIYLFYLFVLFIYFIYLFYLFVLFIYFISGNLRTRIMQTRWNNENDAGN